MARGRRPKGARLSPARLSAAVLMVIALGGCGATTRYAITAQRPATSTQPALTRAQFIAQADAICRALKLKRDSIQQRVNEAKSAKAAVPLAHQYIADARSADEQIAALRPPVADQAAFHQLNNGYSEEAEEASAGAEDLASEQVEAGQKATRTLHAKVAFDEGLARGIGLTDCTNSKEAGG
jgi:hypothetical protein